MAVSRRIVPDAIPSKPNHDNEKVDDTNIREDWKVVEYPVAEPVVEQPTLEQPIVEDTEPEEPGYRSQFTFDVGWGSWRTTVFEWDMTARFKES
ncbi:hypothetical protein BKA58DRAFT_463534 [Alternaria rosae]|uniref:uncharacterized protein n=1 Tax=Alternaria rosae TaxID=1187941 RepID=UPI001E8E3368|nr:uncharacterized protein BKA58DRAFT_463534 [Alternaria rosae]KAH6881432.1 hypothetical protein BKA58DRAFT_463534 [Alternaria rosae]